MCPADCFGIEYEINAWMHANDQVNHVAAQKQVIGTPILEFRKSGGGVKCMTLELRK